MTKSPFSQALSDLLNSIRKYIDIRLTLVKLDVMEKMARIVSLTIAAVFILTLFMLFLIFLSMAAALWIGELLEHQALGYLCVAGFYLLFGTIIYAVRRRLFLRSVIKHMSEIFFEDKNQQDDEDD